MNGFLLDTNVLSEPAKPSPNGPALAWLNSLPSDAAWISVISLGEIRRGIDRLPASRKKASLEVFLRDLQARFGRRVLPVDCRVALRWGRVTASAEAAGKRLATADALVAATALEHDLTIASRDAGYFDVEGVSRFNPFAQHVAPRSRARRT